MRRIAHALAALALACSIGSCSSDGPSALPVAAFAGEWVLESAENASCAGAAGPATRYFTVETDGYAQGVFNVVTDWDFVKPFRGYGWLVTGNFNLGLETVELNFWHTTLQVGAMFTGTIDRDGSVTGVLRDPKPGYRPHTVIGSCVFQATLRKLP